MRNAQGVSGKVYFFAWGFRGKLVFFARGFE